MNTPKTFLQLYSILYFLRIFCIYRYANAAVIYGLLCTQIHGLTIRPIYDTEGLEVIHIIIPDA